MIDYLHQLRGHHEVLFQQMEEEAARDHIPIMDAVGFEAYRAFLQLQRPKKMLELGTAIGYSALRMAEALPDVEIVSIERDEQRFERAQHYVKKSSAADRIRLIRADALDESLTFSNEEPFDALFIDAAKGQYRRFFDKYAPVVKRGGVIYCDNLFMHGMVFEKIDDIPRRKRTMIRNIRQFTEWLVTHPDYDVSIVPVGDGIGIARKK